MAERVNILLAEPRQKHCPNQNAASGISVIKAVVLFLRASETCFGDLACVTPPPLPARSPSSSSGQATTTTTAILPLPSSKLSYKGEDGRSIEGAVSALDGAANKAGKAPFSLGGISLNHETISSRPPLPSPPARPPQPLIDIHRLFCSSPSSATGNERQTLARTCCSSASREGRRGRRGRTRILFADRVKCCPAGRPSASFREESLIFVILRVKST